MFKHFFSSHIFGFNPCLGSNVCIISLSSSSSSFNKGYHQLLKTLHWNTTSHAKHVLSDDIDEDILEYEDRLAEIMMGHFNERFSVGSLKSFLPESRDLKSLLKELDTDLDKYSKTL